MATTAQDKSIEERLSVETPTEDGKIWHDAACHCHGVEYKILFAPLYPPYTGGSVAGPTDSDSTAMKKGEPPACVRCNCSICNKNGYINIYPDRKDVVFTKGYDTLRTYNFATCRFDHKFCPTCGSSLLVDPNGNVKSRDFLVINARMFKDFNIDRISFMPLPGRDKINTEYNDKYT